MEISWGSVNDICSNFYNKKICILTFCNFLVMCIFQVSSLSLVNLYFVSNSFSTAVSLPLSNIQYLLLPSRVAYLCEMAHTTRILYCSCFSECQSFRISKKAVCCLIIKFFYSSRCKQLKTVLIVLPLVVSYSSHPDLSLASMAAFLIFLICFHTSLCKRLICFIIFSWKKIKCCWVMLYYNSGES